MAPKSTTLTLYKAVREDGTDFKTGRINYAAALTSGETIKHPKPGRVGHADASTYLSVSVSPHDLPGASWPLRLFEVEAVGDLWDPNDSFPNKRAVHELRVIREVDPMLVYGPEGARVRELVDAFYALSYTARDAMYYARPDGFSDAYWRVRDAAVSLGVWSCPARFGLRLFGDDWSAGLGGALALLVRGIDPKAITDADYETLTAPWREKQGPVSPKDNLPAKGFTPKKSREKK